MVQGKHFNFLKQNKKNSNLTSRQRLRFTFTNYIPVHENNNNKKTKLPFHQKLLFNCNMEDTKWFFILKTVNEMSMKTQNNYSSHQVLPTIWPQTYIHYYFISKFKLISQLLFSYLLYRYLCWVAVQYGYTSHRMTNMTVYWTQIITYPLTNTQQHP